MKLVPVLVVLVAVTTANISKPPQRSLLRSRPDNDNLSNLTSFTKYSTYGEIVDYVAKLGELYPDLVETSSIGETVEGRQIPAIRISHDVKNSDWKPVVLIDAGIHAREWAAPAVADYIIYQLTEKHQDHEELLKKLDIRVVPLVNPDGYIFSMLKDRMWRKNRAKTPDPQCMGVDLNRNFDLFFGGIGTSRDPCDETYVGKGPFSEPETQALRNYALGLKPRLCLYITLHSYGKYFLYPWGFGEVLPRDWRDLDQLARAAEKALSSVRGTHYAVGSSTQLLGAAAGGSDDWMKARAGAKYSYTVELPGGGEEGFDLPEERVLDVAQEFFVGLCKALELVAAEKAAKPPSDLSSPPTTTTTTTTTTTEPNLPRRRIVYRGHS